MNLVKHGLKWISISIGLLAGLSAIIYAVIVLMAEFNVPSEIIGITLVVLGWGGAFGLLWIYMYLYKKAGHFKPSPKKEQLKLAKFFKWFFAILLLIFILMVILGLSSSVKMPIENILIIAGLIFLVIFFTIKHKKLKKK